MKNMFNILEWVSKCVLPRFFDIIWGYFLLAQDNLFWYFSFGAVSSSFCEKVNIKTGVFIIRDNRVRNYIALYTPVLIRVYLDCCLQGPSSPHLYCILDNSETNHKNICIWWKPHIDVYLKVTWSFLQKIICRSLVIPCRFSLDFNWVGCQPLIIVWSVLKPGDYRDWISR